METQPTDTIKARWHDLRQDPPQYKLYINDQWVEVDEAQYHAAATPHK